MRKRIASFEEDEVEDVQTPAKGWPSSPTITAPPGRKARHAAPAVNTNARPSTKNRVVLSTSPQEVPAGRNVGPSAKLQRLDGAPDVFHARRKAKRNKDKNKEAVVQDDGPTEELPMHAMLNADSRGKDKDSDSNTIENNSEDGDLVIFPPGVSVEMAASDDDDPRRATPMRCLPLAGSVKQKVQASLPLQQSGTKQPASNHDSPATAANAGKLSRYERMKGKQAEHPPPAQGTGAYPPTSYELSTVSRKTRSGTIPKVFGPIPLAAFCIDQDRWCNTEDKDQGEPTAHVEDGHDDRPDAYLKVTLDSIEVYGDAACSRKPVHAFRKQDIKKIEATAKGSRVPGGMSFRLTNRIDTYNSPVFFSDDEAATSCILLRFAAFKEPGWSLPQQDDLLARIARFLGRKPACILPCVLDSRVALARPRSVGHRQVPLLNPRLASSKQRTRGRQTQAIHGHLAPNDTDNEVSAYPFSSSRPCSGDSDEAGPSWRSQSLSTFRGRASDGSLDTIEYGPLEHMPPVQARNQPPSKPADDENLDEIIVVWPCSGRGALNITLGDLRRLMPGELLNDTMIEFGLKYWLHNLHITHNSILDDIHVFSSFFYKKLDQKKFQEGYQSVRKWTRKVDIFKKKYIIVPINEHTHWYLAIIYCPEYVLRPPGSTEKPRRVSTRILAQRRQDEEKHTDDAMQQPDQVPMDVGAGAIGRLAHDSPVDERSIIGPTLIKPDEDTQVEPLTMVTDDDEDAPMAEGTEPVARERSISLGSGRPPVLDSVMHTALDSAEPTVAPAPATLDDEKAVHERKDGTDAEEGGDLMKRSYIFILDSIGGQHPRVITNLQKYLRAEAEDKHKVPQGLTSTPSGKHVVVPQQPNSWDCGLYLLHFAEVFIRDPEKFTREILAPGRGRGTTDMKLLWHSDEVLGKRIHMRDILLTLSDEWKEKQAEKLVSPKAQEQDKANEDSDDEVVFVEPAVVPKKLSVKSGKVGPRK